MSTKQRFFSVKTDVGILPAGIKAHDCPGGNCIKGKGVTFPSEAKPDMFVFYKDSDKYSIDPSSSIPAGSIIIVGQYKADSNGVIREIVKIMGDKMSASTLLSLRGAVPQVARNEVSRWMFTCVKKNTLYGLNVDIQSNRTRQEFAQNKEARYPLLYDTTEAAACETCDDTTVCRTIVCGMVDQFNGNQPGDGGFVEYREEPKPVKAFYYNDTNFIFCLDGSESACGGCDTYTGIKGIHIQGKDILFGDTMNTTTTSHTSQINRLIEQIDCAFNAHQGTSWIGSGTLSGACLSLELFINTCVDGVQLIKHDGTYLAPCRSESVSFTKTNTKPCVNCGDSNLLTTTYNCAIGFIGQVAEENCNCEGKSDNPVTYYPTHVNVSAISGFVDGVFEVVVPGLAPENFGVQLWDTAYRADVRPGFYDHNRRTGGWTNHLLDRARNKGIELVCNVPYCVISWAAKAYGHWVDDIGLHGGTVVENYIAVPMSFATKTALIADLNAIKNVDNCLGIVDITCTEDPQPGPPSPSVSSTPYATPSVTASVTKSATPSVSSSPSTSATPSITPSVSITPSTSPA